MDQTPDIFELEYKDGKIRGKRQTIGGMTVYRVVFSDQSQPLTLTRALHANAQKFWTSIPEGRQVEAEHVGAVIEQYYQSLS